MDAKVEARLKEMQDAWQTGKDTAPGVPDGVYNLQIVSAQLAAAKTSGKLSIRREFVVLDGEQEGNTVYDQLSLETEQGPYFCARWVRQMGFEAPEDLTDLGDVINAISEAHPVVVANVQRSGDFINVRISELVHDSAALSEKTAERQAAKDTGGKPTKAAPAAVAAAVTPALKVGAEVEFDDGAGNVQAGVIKGIGKDKEGTAVATVDVNGEEWEVLLESLSAPTTDPGDVTLAGEPDVKLAALLAFAQAHGVTVEDGSTAEAVATTLNEYEWQAAELTSDEQAVLTEAGVEMVAAPAPAPKPVKPAAKPAAKAAPTRTTAKPATKSPAKPAAKPATKSTVTKTKKK